MKFEKFQINKRGEEKPPKEKQGFVLSNAIPKASKMDVKKKTFTYDGEEVTITASENWFKNFANSVIEEYKIGLAQNIVKKEYQCSSCKIFPRPGVKFVRKCTKCFKIFCNDCSCPHNQLSFSQQDSNLPVKVVLSTSLDVDKYLPYFCQNNKFGCEEIFFTEVLRKLCI